MKGLHKILLRLWLVIWIITLPLVHIHPEADHAHGMSGHIHGGTYHSILVNTPVHAHEDHELHHHHHDGFFFLGDESEPSHSQSHPPHDFEEATYGFSIIKPSKILESEKSQCSYDLVVAPHVEVLNFHSNTKTSFKLTKRHFSIPSKTRSPRAPPISSI